MRKLKFEEIDGAKCVVLNGRVYDFVEEVRGVRDKFWLVQHSGTLLKMPLKNTNILFKYNRNDVSCENWGEVYASRIAKQMLVPCVEYHLATYEYNGHIANGVLCGTYKKNSAEYEVSVYDAQQIQTERVEKINTVEDTIENLMLLIPKNKDATFYYDYLRNSLIKQCIFDFLLAQTDRHWFNTTFLLYYNNGNFNIRKADCYDNGCICFLKRKYAAIEGISREIKVQGKNSQRLKDLLKSYVPMMGIKTPTVQLSDKQTEMPATKLKVKKETREIFLDELTDEILFNPEIAKFFIDVQYNLDVNEVTKMLEREGTKPPQAVADIVEQVVGHQLKILTELLNEKVRIINSSSKMEV